MVSAEAAKSSCSTPTTPVGFVSSGSGRNSRATPLGMPVVPEE
jgi:hypothetical protein